MEHNLSIADNIVNALNQYGVSHYYLMTGGMITTIVDAIKRSGKGEIICMHHEQAAGFAAEAHSRVSDQFQVAMATSGPGATNLITSIASCFFDSTPLLFITGQVNTSEMAGECGVRQLGFQETDIVKIVKPITKYSKQLANPEDVSKEIQNAVSIAHDSRPGPVLLDIPMNLQRASVENFYVPSIISNTSQPNAIDNSFIVKFQNLLLKSKRPLILAGAGIRISGATDIFKQFLEKISIPVVQSLLGLDSLHASHPLRVGFIGTYGNRWANYAMERCDLLIVFGSRMDVRQFGKLKDKFLQTHTIIRIDCDNNELKTVENCSLTLCRNGDS